MFGAARSATYYMGGGGAGGGAAPAASWDITTATSSYTTTARLGNEDGTPQDIYFKDDGTKMYFVGSTNDRVYEYTLSTAWNIFSAVYSTFISIGTQETTGNALAFSSDGTKMYVLGQANDTVYQYTLSTAWLVSSATYASKSFVVSGQSETVPTGLDFSTDGTKMYIIGSIADTVYQYTLSTAYDVSTAAYASKSFSVSTQTASPTNLRLADSGTKMYVTDASYVYQYTLSTANDVSTATYASKQFQLGAIAGGETNNLGFYIKSDGSRMFVTGSSLDYAWSLNLGTAWDVTTISTTFTDSLRVGAQDGTPVGITFRPTGLTAYMLGQSNDRVYQYTLSTAWDINTASYASLSSPSLATQEGAGQDITFGDSGTKMYLIGTTADTIYQYTLSTAWNISTATYATKSFSVTTQESFPTGIAFKSDGTKFYVVGEGASRVFQYSCSTAWDISTGSYDTVNILVSGQVTVPSSLSFGNSGTKLYVLGQGNDLIAQYTLSTAWDISTAAFDTGKTLSVLNVDHQAFGLAIADDGSRVYVVGQNTDRIVQWALT
jgi:sugar lactone lactonase YvrE